MSCEAPSARSCLSIGGRARYCSCLSLAAPVFLLPSLRRATGSIAILAALTGIASACRPERDPIPPPDDAALGRDFYPVAVGKFWVYDVEDHTWDLNNDSVERYQVRERVDTVYRGAAGETTYRLVRSRRPDSQSVWRDDSVFALVVTPQAVRRTFANVPTLDLVFPIREGVSWNPNQLNAADSLVRTYRDVDQPLVLTEPATRYEKTLLVLDEGEDNPLFLRAQQARYARGIGRIERSRRHLDFCNTNEEQRRLCVVANLLPNGQYYIARGTERHEVLRDYGPR